MPEIKAVIDTNIFIRALLGSPVNEKIYNAFRDGEFILIISKEMIEELIDVLSRPKLKITLEEIKQLLHLIKTKAKIIGQTKNIHACRDRSDDIILEAAVSANASIVVTNDKDLLVLSPFRKISVIEPHQFLELLINS